jgi:hypothetical protein
MAVEYDIAPGTPEDVPAILALQEEPLSGSGGSLSARLPADWFERAMQKNAAIVGRRNRALVGYVLATLLATQMHIPIVQAMVAKFPAPPHSFIHLCRRKRTRQGPCRADVRRNARTATRPRRHELHP